MILFLARHYTAIKDDKNDDLHTSNPCLTRSVYVLLMTWRSIADDVTITTQLWGREKLAGTNGVSAGWSLACPHGLVKSDISNSLDADFIHVDKCLFSDLNRDVWFVTGTPLCYYTVFCCDWWIPLTKRQCCQNAPMTSCHYVYLHTVMMISGLLQARCFLHLPSSAVVPQDCQVQPRLSASTSCRPCCRWLRSCW